MREDGTNKAELTQEELARLDALAALPDEQIDTSDLPELTDEQWRSAVRGRNLSLARRLDRDVVDWFVERGEDYPAELNRVLRDYIASQPTRKRVQARRSA